VILLDENEVELGPFEFAPDWRSLVGGLGGAQQGPDDHYVFHTPYADFGQEEVLVTLRFDGLVATRGMIVLRVHAYSSRPGAAAYQIAYAEAPLRLIAADGGTTTLRFRPAANVLHAVLGHIYDGTDATAAGLRVTARRLSAVEAEAEAVTDERRTSFGASTIRAVPQLMSAAAPRLATPISQPCTRPQLAEPVYAEWAARMHEAPAHDSRQWGHIYILQALRSYGVLEAGAQAIGFGPDAGAIPAVLADIGCHVTMADPDAMGVEVWRNPALCDDATFDRNVFHRPLNRADLPDDLTGFDLLWSQRSPNDLSTVTDTVDFIHRSLACLKPGGMAVHMVSYDPLPGAEADAAGNPILRRGDLDRLALGLIGHGHEIAQFTYSGGDRDPTAFGIIARRGLRT
jgi:hypothetical protein